MRFKEQTTETMIKPTESPSLMYQDFQARRPLEIETFLGAPIKLAQNVGVQVPRIETLYALLHNVNTINQTRPQQPPQASMPTSPSAAGPPPRLSSAPGQRGPMNGLMNGPMNGPMNRPMNGSMPGRGGMMPRGSRAPSMTGVPPPGMRRGPPPMNGYPPRMMNGNGYPPRGPSQQMSRRPSFEGNDLEEFSYLNMYDNIPEGEMPEGGFAADGTPTPSSSGGLVLREREMMLRQREMALAQQEQMMRRRMPPPPVAHGGYDDDDEDGEDFFDPMAQGHGPRIDPDNFDMMSVTSKRTRKTPSATQLRNNPEMDAGRQSRNMWGRPKPQARTSARLMADVPGLHDSLMNNPMLGYSSDRYGTVDRANMGVESRTNSLTAERLNELTRGGNFGNGAYPPITRRASQSPGNPLSPNGRPVQRPSPPNGFFPTPGQPPQNGRPSPPGMRAPMPRHAPGHGNAVAPGQVEQQVGVSNLYPPKNGPQVRSLTGSASASAGSGDSSRSAPIDSEPSAHSSASSLGPRPPIGVR
ncbi:hypothetical protein H2203_000375 [Taxawa tesnikishii (nom. ined.)]|nr:hypothetical protein H2203_000375 [Dothideales sp. JES 119]